MRTTRIPDRPDPGAAPPPQGCSHLKLRQAGRVVGRHYDRALAAVGLKTTQYSLLSQVVAREPVRPADLAAAMALEASTLTRNLRALQAQGWVAVGPGADERSRLVRATPAGRAKRAEAQRAWKKAQLTFNDRLGPARVAALHALLDDCVARLGADDEAGDHDD